MQTDLLITFFLSAVGIFYLLLLASGRQGGPKDLYTTQGSISPLVRGMGLAADWLCAATLLGFFALLIDDPKYAQWILIGWVSGLVILGLMVAPAIYRSGQACLASFVSEYYYSRLLGFMFMLILAAIGIMLLSLQLKAMGYIFSRYIQIPASAGIFVSFVLLAFYVIISNIKAITRVQIISYMILISALFVLGAYLADIYEISNRWFFLQFLVLEMPLVEIEERAIELTTSASLVEPEINSIEWLLTLIAIIAGTAMLPHMVKRFQGAKVISEIPISAVWLLIFIGVVYSSMPLLASVSQAKLELELESVNELTHEFQSLSNWIITSESASISNEFEGYQSQPTFIEGFQLLLLSEVYKMQPWVTALVTTAILAALLSTASVLIVTMVRSISFQFSAVNSSLAPSLSISWLIGMLVLAIASSVAMVSSLNFIEWLNRMIALSAASICPTVILAVLGKKYPARAVIVGSMIGFISVTSYALAFDNQWLNQIFPPSWPVYSPIAVASIAMLLNVSATIGLSKVLSLQLAPEPS